MGIFDVSGLGSVADAVGGIAKGIIAHFLPPTMTDEEKVAAENQITAVIAAQVNTIVGAQQAVMVAELQQSDIYTKRARPTVVYAGTAIFIWNGIVGPLIAWIASVYGSQIIMPPVLNLPNEFWLAWGGVVGTYSIGRSLEKTGSTNKVVQAITGGKK
ncbi:MAG: hypothetical protein HQK60_04285 [Deltaproteobacteria bacterium]|nr:hypothetical protein [Deltaproteobacteria bacterium]